MKKPYLLDVFKFLNENELCNEKDLKKFYKNLVCKYDLDSNEKKAVKDILWHDSDYDYYYEDSLC